MRTEDAPSNNSLPNLTAMLRFSPDKCSMSADEIDAILTPPSKGSNWSTITDTPVTSTTHDADGSYTEICSKRLGRFLSFDVKRSLFSSKRHADTDASVADDSPASKRLRDAERGIGAISLKAENETSDGTPCVKSIVHMLASNDDLVGDGSRPYALPTSGYLKSITPDALKDVLGGCYADEIDEVTLIDCRYPYEYDGGHIQGALNLYTRDAIEDYLQQHSLHQTTHRRHVLIFHCEFSSERGPKMYKHMRSEDRGMNKDHYPRLQFPEMYLLQGGYKTFYNTHMDLCEPQCYTPMLHKDHSAELRHFRGKSKSWTAGERPHGNRTSLRF